MRAPTRARRARVEDALNATRAAVEEGIVPGGGVALLRCVPALDEMKLTGDMAVGVPIVKRALEEPSRQIVINDGVEGAVIVMEVKKNKKAASGSTRRPRSTATCCRRGSWTRRRSRARRSRTRRRSPA